MSNVAVFWDYENTRVPFDTTPQAATACIRQVALSHGSLQSVRVYFDSAYEQSTSNSLSRSQLQMSGFTLVDTPHAGSKDVADVQLISDMMVWAVEQGRGSTVILISSDKDFSYPLSLLRNRSINVVLMSTGSAPEGLKAAATSALIWRIVLGLPEKPPAKEKTSLLTSRPLYDRPVRILPRTSRAAPPGYSSAPSAPSKMLQILAPPLITQEHRPIQPLPQQPVKQSAPRSGNPPTAPLADRAQFGIPTAPLADRQYLHWTPYASPLRRPTLNNSPPVPLLATVPFHVQPVASGSKSTFRPSSNAHVNPLASGSNGRAQFVLPASGTPTGPMSKAERERKKEAAKRAQATEASPTPTKQISPPRNGEADKKHESTPLTKYERRNVARRETRARKKASRAEQREIETIVIPDTDSASEDEDEAVETSLLAIRKLKRKLSEVDLEEEEVEREKVVERYPDAVYLARKLAKSDRKARKKAKRLEQQSVRNDDILAAAQARGEALLATIMGTAPDALEVGMGGDEEDLSMEVIGHTTVDGLEQARGSDQSEEEENGVALGRNEEMGDIREESITNGDASVGEDDSLLSIVSRAEEDALDGAGEDAISVDSPHSPEAFFEDIEGEGKLLGVENGDSEVILFGEGDDSPPHSRRKKYDGDLSGNSS